MLLYLIYMNSGIVWIGSLFLIVKILFFQRLLSFASPFVASCMLKLVTKTVNAVVTVFAPGACGTPPLSMPANHTWLNKSSWAMAGSMLFELLGLEPSASLDEIKMLIEHWPRNCTQARTVVQAQQECFRDWIQPLETWWATWIIVMMMILVTMRVSLTFRETRTAHLFWVTSKGTVASWSAMDGLTHWGRVMHICVSDLTSIGSDNGLSPGWRQAIMRTNAGILLIRPLGTNFSEILIEIHTFSFRKMHLKMSSAKGRLFSLGLSVLSSTIQDGSGDSLRRQDISSYDIDYIEYVGPSLTWERILSTLII